MKIWTIIICCGLVLFPLLMQAQEQKISDRIGVELGSGGFFGTTVAPDRVRLSRSVYEYDDFHSDYPNSSQFLDINYGGVKYESFFYENRLGLATGLRFSEFSSKIGSDWERSYFIWLFRQDETTTDYLTIHRIKQKSYYIGIPLELRYFLSTGKKPLFNQYIKLGAAVNYCLSTTNSITFYEQAMTKYTRAVEEQIGKPNPFNAWVYPTYGLRYDKIKNIWINMEIYLLGFFIGGKAHPFIHTETGMGVQFSVQIPLNTNNQ